MSAVRKTGMLIASIFALLAFCWQANACFAEHAGFISCHEQAGDSPVANEVGEGHCCHVETNAASGQSFPAASLASQEISYHARPFDAPDGPVEEIDHPPQILS